MRIKETDILLICDIEGAFTLAEGAIRSERASLEGYIRGNQDFARSLIPLKVEESAPEIVRAMAEASSLVGTGPMSAVAGAITDVAVRAMCSLDCRKAMAENGGDVSIMRGDSVVRIEPEGLGLEGELGLSVSEGELPLGICSSSGRFGHSMSLGDAALAVAVAGSGVVADAAATALCNLIRDEDLEGSMQSMLEFAEEVDEIDGCLVFGGGRVAKTGRLPRIVGIELDYY